MKAFLFTFFLTMTACLAAMAQDSLTDKLDKELVFRKGYTMKLYKLNSHNPCEQEKAVAIVYNGKLSSCFDYVRNISSDTAQRIVKLIRTPATYGGGYPFCFYTDYALLITNAKNEVCGYVSVSFNCNQLIPYPKVKEQEVLSKGELHLFGFSKKGYTSLATLLSLTKDVGVVWRH